MKFRDILSEKKGPILKMWFEKALESYPAETAHFFKEKNKQFTNPVGYSISAGLERLFEELLGENGIDRERVTPVLDGIVRIQAVQDAAPSEALSFLFRLKEVIREEPGLEKDLTPAELRDLDSRIDLVVLMAFDIFVKCREKIYELRADEVTRRTYRLLQMANLVNETERQ